MGTQSPQNPLKSIPFQHPRVPPAVWAKYHEWIPLEWRVCTLLLLLYRLWCISVLGVLSYGHKKRILSLIRECVSYVLSEWLLSPIPYPLLSELLVSLVLRKLNSLISIFIALDMNFMYAIGYRKRYWNRGVPLMNWLLLSTNHKWFSMYFTIHFIFLFFILILSKKS